MISSTFAFTAAAADNEYIIVEFNTATRAPDVNLPLKPDENAIRRAVEEDQRRAAMEQTYVQAKVADWKSRFSLSTQGIELLHIAGTSPYVIEASHQAVVSMIADATWDGNISVMRASELLEFDREKLNSIFKTSDDALLGEFVEAHFKHEVLFAVWRAMNPPRAFSGEPDMYQNFAKNVSSLALAKLNRLEQFLRRRNARYMPDLIKIDRLANEILTGYIAIESLPESATYPTRSSFFDSLEFFDDMGFRILLTNPVASGRVVDRWIGYQSRVLTFPHVAPKRLPSHARALSLLGHRQASVRQKFTNDLVALFLNHEDQREVIVRGVPVDRQLRMALSVAQEREAAERFHSRAIGLAQLDGDRMLERRYQIAEDLLRKAHPDVKITLGKKILKPPDLLVDIIDEMVHLDFKGLEFGTNFSVYFYRLSALQILNSIIAKAKNEEFRNYVNSRVVEWFYRLRSTDQNYGLEPNLAILEHNMKIVETRRTCEGLFRSTE